MKPPLSSYLLACTLALSGGPLFAGTTEPALSSKPAQVSIAIDGTAAGKAISPDLFGIFFEDLNYAADGGLYAELVQNRSFEYNSSERREWNELSTWTVTTRGGASGNVAVRTAKPIHPNNPHYVSLEAKTPGAGFGITNEGFDGIPVKEGAAYTFSLFAHQLFMGEAWGPENGIENKPMPLSIHLETADGEILAEGTLDITGRDWKRQELRLMPRKSAPKAHLVILATAKGGVALDEISLFPEKTFRGRRNGLRADLAELLADLKPKFVRFPGGCLAHGDGTNNFYRWKDTIGPLEQRRGQRNLWGYHQTVGLGYFEYFQFCEDIGAKPLPVLPAAVSCQNSDFSPGHGQQCLPLEDLPTYIQDILDLIEWANGPVTSTWGAKRAEAGHPAPFGLKYLGLGNEDAITPDFEQRYQVIEQAIHSRHPEIVVIGTVGPFPDGEDFERGWSFARKQGVAMVDEHYYRSPEWFWENQTRYDAYDRKGPAVYAGEYAAHEPDRRNTLRSALAEAAGCIAFERNGDVVRLASYAPLLARRGHTQWSPDMIYFTGTEAYPSINYQVQRLFGHNGGDRLLPLSRKPSATAGEQLAMSAVRDTATGELIVKLVNGGGSPLVADLDLALPAGSKRRLVATLLTAPDAALSNEDGKPPVALPITEELDTGGRFTRLLPAHSLSILRLK